MFTNHIGIRVSNIEVSEKFYSEVMGFTLKERFENEKLILVFLQNENTVIELVYQKDGLYNYVKNGILEHMAFTVPDIEKYVEKLKEHNITFISKNIIKFKGELIIFFEGPDGEKLELVQSEGVN